MLTIWHSVALGSVLSLSIAGSPAQYSPHLGLNIHDQEALAKHHLTVQNVRQMFAVDRDLLRLLKEAPELDARAAEFERTFDSQRLGIVAAGGKMYEAMPEIAQILQRQQISGRDYLLTKTAAMIVEIVADGLVAGAVERESIGEGFFLASALKFWTSMDPAFKAEAVAWKEVREELAKQGRHKVW